MRQADINRVKRAKEHLKAATTILSSIKWENMKTLEDNFVREAKVSIREADFLLDDIIGIQK